MAEVEFTRASQDTEQMVKDYLDAHPYVMQKIEGFAGPHTITAGGEGARAIVRSRPMVQLFDKNGDEVAQVPLPIARVRKSSGKSGGELTVTQNYGSVCTDPLYENVPWAHDALQALAAEYDRLEELGLRDLYLSFHDTPHRLVLMQKGAQALTMIGNKLLGQLDEYHRYCDYRGNHDVGEMAFFDSDSGAPERFVSFNADMYAKINEPSFAHELVHVIDVANKEGLSCYSNNSLFEHALISDIGRSKFEKERIAKDIVYPTIGIGTPPESPEDASAVILREMFAIVFERWFANPEKATQDYPCVVNYIQKFVLPDLSLRHAANKKDQSFLYDYLATEHGEQCLETHHLDSDGQEKFIDAMGQLLYKQFNDPALQKMDLHSMLVGQVKAAHALVEKFTPNSRGYPREKLENMDKCSKVIGDAMLKSAGLDEYPARRIYSIGR